MGKIVRLCAAIVCASALNLPVSAGEPATSVAGKLKELFAFEDMKSQTQEAAAAAQNVQKDFNKGDVKHVTSLMHVGVADIVEPLLPAVVNIVAVREDRNERRAPTLEIPEGHPLGELLRQFLEQETTPQPRKSTSFGSGFAISADGYIVTSYHVIADADKVMVTLDTAHPLLKDRFLPDAELEAEVVGVDPRTDIALLKVKETNLPFVEFGNSGHVRVGDPILTIGNPFGLGGTVTTGVISSKARDIGARSSNMGSDIVPGYLQIDAAINMGNSGGPIFDMSGNVIGVNMAILSPSGGNIGIGFAVPADVVREVIEQLKAHGRTRRGWLGILVQPVDPDIAQTLGLKEPRGALVSDINPKGPATDSGLQAGDVILSFNHEKVVDSRGLPRVVGKAPVGQTVPLVVWRDGKEETLSISVGEYEKAEDEGYIASGDKPAKPRAGDVIAGLGFAVRPLTDAEKKELDEDAGLVITYVDESSQAFGKGLRPGQLVRSANTVPVRNKADLIEQVQRSKGKAQDKKAILLLVGLKDRLRFIAIDIDAKS